MRPIHTKELKPGVALITGGAKRIGKEISKNLAYDGWKVIIHYNTNNIAAKNLKNQIIKRKGKAAIIKCDLNNNNSVKDLIEKSKKKFGYISLLINNASKWAKEKDGLGVDIVFDAAGVSDSLLIAMDLVRPNGQITKVGWGPKPLGFSIDSIVQKNISLQGSFSHNWPIWERVVQLLSNGSLDVKHIIGGIWSINDWEKAFREMYSGKIVKSILKPV